MKDILKKLRKYEIRIRKALNSHMQGDYHSIFKGSGLEYDDIRSYQYGDDIRTIDWNVSAKGQGTFVKTFREEKEQNVFLILDVSASQEIGTKGRQKMDISKEISALLAMSAIKENSQVGLICFSDQKEKYVKPGKGMKHSFSLVNEIFKLVPQSKKTALSKAFRFTNQLLKKKSIVILISDFIDEDYQHDLKGLAHKHDLIAIHISDIRETRFPNLGIIPIEDKESGRTLWRNTSSREFRKILDQTHGQKQADLEQFCKRNQTDYIKIQTDEDYVPKLIKMFKVRNKAGKSG
ncbi:DUF58 domain-containing protein [Reichenbachiella agariperforans]|uniref:DUF58 domain-containing protein n=1 Tax=Reichenbachiella agariperforans TaxID=156994 RepID=A0A1M6VLD5_REIAG|nr:DUF58 domain-containing protein [Reichenbachiella agariperforans]MBU2914601.1 DUF58 domain-containing protein [Reichenbachiella agariperforans]SHK82288.1 Protein of unknown function DUF58 [Reichenbachiella agariperforans]